MAKTDDDNIFLSFINVMYKNTHCPNGHSGILSCAVHSFKSISPFFFIYEHISQFGHTLFQMQHKLTAHIFLHNKLYLPSVMSVCLISSSQTYTQCKFAFQKPLININLNSPKALTNNTCVIISCIIYLRSH